MQELCSDGKGAMGGLRGNRGGVRFGRGWCEEVWSKGMGD